MKNDNKINDSFSIKEAEMTFKSSINFTKEEVFNDNIHNEIERNFELYDFEQHSFEKPESIFRLGVCEDNQEVNFQKLNEESFLKKQKINLDYTEKDFESSKSKNNFIYFKLKANILLYTLRLFLDYSFNQ